VHKQAITVGVATISGGILAAMMAISPAVAGPVSVHGITTQVVATTATVAADSVNQAEATCGTGELLVGGGYKVNGTFTDRQVFIDAPANNTTWLVEVVNPSPTAPSLTFSAYAICAMSVPGKKGVTGFTTQVVQAPVDAPANATAEADATCPAGELRTGGGYDVDNVSRRPSTPTQCAWRRRTPLPSSTWRSAPSSRLRQCRRTRPRPLMCHVVPTP
jgi:hypothetical protein